MGKYLDSFEPNRCYHVFNHAVHNNNLFVKDTNYQYFLQQLIKHTNPVCQLYAYCLMPNHFHLLIRIKDEDSIVQYYHQRKLSKNPEYKPLEIDLKEFDYHDFVMQQFQNFCNGYVQAFNRMFERKGALFLDFIKRRQVKNEKYFTKLIHYIHYNPIHHGFCKDLHSWQYTSFHLFLDNRVTKLEREYVLEWFGGQKEYTEFHKLTPDPRLVNLMEL
jgi:putative transposase